MNLILFDKDHSNYLPLSFTRPISSFRVGIFTIKENGTFIIHLFLLKLRIIYLKSLKQIFNMIIYGLIQQFYLVKNL